MARIAGIDLPGNKRIEIALTYIYGIGISRSRKILNDNSISFNIKTKNLTEIQIKNLRDYIERSIKVEGDLRSEVFLNIKRLIDISCYRGLRHRKGLPVNGQRTRTNANTRKSRRKSNVTNRSK